MFVLKTSQMRRIRMGGMVWNILMTVLVRLSLLLFWEEIALAMKY